MSHPGSWSGSGKAARLGSLETIEAAERWSRIVYNAFFPFIMARFVNCFRGKDSLMDILFPLSSTILEVVSSANANKIASLFLPLVARYHPDSEEVGLGAAVIMSYIEDIKSLDETYKNQIREMMNDPRHNSHVAVYMKKYRDL